VIRQEVLKKEKYEEVQTLTHDFYMKVLDVSRK
jgi:acetolactate synthase small subunit